MVEEGNGASGEARKPKDKAHAHFGHRPTFTRKHTLQENRKISKTLTGVPKPLFSDQAIENMREGQQRRQDRRREQQAQEAHNVPGEETFFTPDTNNEQPK